VYNPKIHNRKSIRLIGYDYAQLGLYFLTICTQNRKCLFGEVSVNTTLRGRKNYPQMILNDAGKM